MKNDLFGRKAKASLLVTYHCNICNLTFSVPKGLTNTSCAYCGAKNIEEIDPFSYMDYKMVPYVETLNDARSIYKSKIRFNPLVPFSFRSKKMLLSIKKLYLPCALYQVKVSGKSTFYGADKIKNIRNIPKQTFEIGFHSEIEYDNVLICAFSQIPDESLAAVNQFNFSYLNDFDASKIVDCFLVPVNEDTNTITTMVQEKTMNYSLALLRSNVNHELRKVKENNMSVDIKSMQKVFVPIYYMNIPYKNRQYLFLMNGQTGDIYMDPITSKVSVVLFSIILFFLILGILMILSCFL